MCKFAPPDNPKKAAPGMENIVIVIVFIVMGEKLVTCSWGIPVICFWEGRKND